MRKSVRVLALAIGVACGRGVDQAGTPGDSVSSRGGRSDSSAIYSTSALDSLGADSLVVPPRYPFAVSILAADSAAGQRVYRGAGQCIACHGLRGEGVAGLGSSMTDTIWTNGDGSLSFLEKVVRDGIARPVGGTAPMPGAPALSEQDVFSAAAYIYALSHAGSTVRDSASLPVGSPPIARLPRDTTGAPAPTDTLGTGSRTSIP